MWRRCNEGENGSSKPNEPDFAAIYPEAVTRTIEKINEALKVRISTRT
jgi:hypothetical protein